MGAGLPIRLKFPGGRLLNKTLRGAWFAVLVGMLGAMAPEVAWSATVVDPQTLEALSNLSDAEREALMERYQGGAAARDDEPDTDRIPGQMRMSTGIESLRRDRANRTEQNRPSPAPDPQNSPRQGSRFDQLGRDEQVSMGRACLERKKRRASREAGAEQAKTPITVPACTDIELDDYLGAVYPFGRFLERPRPFGYELFDQDAGELSSITDIPVPTDYMLGPGDKVEVQLFGKENRRYVLTVTRDGILQFPQLGPIPVAGMSFDEVQELLQARVADSMIGVEASITMGALRSIRIFVLGDVRRPGSYTVSSLSTVTHALFASGGIPETGSLRGVQVKRGGEVVTILDLYDLLLRGDTSDDMVLEPGDVVFIPPVGKTASISGEVVRPATYELRGSATVSELIELSGGLLPTAYLQSASLERVRRQTDRTIATLDLTAPKGKDTALQSGDHLQVYSVFDRAENVVLLTGAFERPGLLQWKEGMRISDAIPDLRRLKARADANYLLIRREVGPERRVETISANPSAALRDPGSPENLLLQSRDQLVVFPNQGTREDLLEPILDDLRQQAGMNQDVQIVDITGRVKAPGEYPLTAPMTVSELVRAAGGGVDDSYPREVEIIRRTIVNGQRREITRNVIDLSDPEAARTLLSPYDTVNVRPIQGWYKTERVQLLGEVKLPGEYVIQPNETIESVVRRAGGFTQEAYLPGTIFSREEIRARQQAELARQGQRLKSELLQVQLDYRGSEKADVDVVRVRQLGALLAEELENAQALGRIVIDMEATLSGRAPIALRDGDAITIPRRPAEVTVLGEVSYPTTHLYQEDFSYKDYLQQSGGFSSRADRGSTFVVRINGEVSALDRADAPMPGDVVIVPFKIDRGRGLFLTSTIAQIIGQLAITAASFKTIGIF